MLIEERRGVPFLSPEFTVRFYPSNSETAAHRLTASYDYGSAIAENRELTVKYPELKRQGLFLRSSPDFYKTDWVGNSTGGIVSVSNPAAFVTLLRNPDSAASFYIARQGNSTTK
jgi:hypothetical protein